MAKNNLSPLAQRYRTKRNVAIFAKVRLIQSAITDSSGPSYFSLFICLITLYAS